MKLQWLILITLFACSSTDPTPYQKAKKGRGFVDRTEENLRISNFKGNSYTKVGDARLYAEFHAIESCRAEGAKYANILDIFDKTESKEVMRTTGSAIGPTYYGSYGMYPYYSRYSNFGVGASFNTISTDTWNETYVYPNIDVYYTCDNKVWRPKVMFREVPAEEMKLLVKDLKGSIQIEKIMPDSPNQKVLIEGDIILKANGKRVERVYQLVQLFNENTLGVKIDILREGENKSITIKATDVSDTVDEAEKKIIAQACKKKEIKTNNICKN